MSNVDFFRFAYDLILTLIELGEKVYYFVTMPLLPASVVQYLDNLPSWVISWSGLSSWEDITFLWVLGAGFVTFAVICVVKWIIGVVM